MIYLDASALVKLVVDEPETAQLQLTISGRQDIVTSLISRIEVMRALQRVAAAPGEQPTSRQLRGLHARAATAFSSTGLVPIDDQIVRLAESVQPPLLRSIDALHLATALSLNDLESVVTYDRRLGEAARESGVKVLAPGASSLPSAPRGEVTGRNR